MRQRMRGVGVRLPIHGMLARQRCGLPSLLAGNHIPAYQWRRYDIRMSSVAAGLRRPGKRAQNPQTRLNSAYNDATI